MDNTVHIQISQFSLPPGTEEVLAAGTDRTQPVKAETDVRAVGEERSLSDAEVIGSEAWKQRLRAAVGCHWPMAILTLLLDLKSEQEAGGYGFSPISLECEAAIYLAQCVDQRLGLPNGIFGFRGSLGDEHADGARLAAPGEITTKSQYIGAAQASPLERPNARPDAGPTALECRDDLTSMSYPSCSSRRATRWPSAIRIGLEADTRPVMQQTGLLPIARKVLACPARLSTEENRAVVRRCEWSATDG